MKYLKYLFIITSHFNQVVLQWTSFSPEVIVLLMLQHKEIGQFLINAFQNVLSRTQKQSISLLKTESHGWHGVPGLWGRYTYARAANIKSLNIFFPVFVLGSTWHYCRGKLSERILPLHLNEFSTH